MADDDESVRGALGIDVAGDYSIPDSVWSTALDLAFDPDTAVSDPALVPEMDDDGDIAPDVGVSDDATVDHHVGVDGHSDAHIVDGEPHLEDPHLADPGHLADHDPANHDPAGHDPHADDHADHDWHG